MQVCATLLVATLDWYPIEHTSILAASHTTTTAHYFPLKKLRNYPDHLLTQLLRRLDHLLKPSVPDFVVAPNNHLKHLLQSILLHIDVSFFSSGLSRPLRSKRYTDANACADFELVHLESNLSTSCLSLKCLLEIFKYHFYQKE